MATFLDNKGNITFPTWWWTGNVIPFSSIHYNVHDLTLAFQHFIINGSQRHLVQKNDLSVINALNNDVSAPTSVSDLLRKGTHFFDAIFYFFLPESDRPAIQCTNDKRPGWTDDVNVLAKSLFYLYFFLLTRANVPSGTVNTPGAAVPGFLINIMNLKESPRAYMQHLASFDVGNIDHSWIKEIKWVGMSGPALNRFGLGVAGYRHLNVFKVVEPANPVPARLMPVYQIIKEFSQKGPFWEIHPITRDPQLIHRCGSLNHNLENLMMDIYTIAEITAMVAEKLLAVTPIRRSRATQYLGWNANTFDFCKSKIFLDSIASSSK